MGGCLRGDLFDHGGVVPDRFEHHLEADCLGGVFEMAHAGDGSRAPLVTEALLREVRGGAHEGVIVAGGVLHHVCAARLYGAGRFGGFKDSLLADPLGALARERALVEAVAQCEFEPRATDTHLACAAGYLELARLLRVGHALDEGGLAEQEAHLVDLGELLFELPVGEHGEIRADYRQFCAVVDGFAEGISQAFGADVAQRFHVSMPPSSRDFQSGRCLRRERGACIGAQDPLSSYHAGVRGFGRDSSGSSRSHFAVVLHPLL